MVSVFAKVFVTPSAMMEYQYLHKLYSAVYQKGWILNLDEQRFNDISKAITGTTHETNNYYQADGGTEKITAQKYGFFRLAERRIGHKQINALIQLIAYSESNGYGSDTVIDDILDQDAKNEKEPNIGLFIIGIARSEWQMLIQSVLD